jgi:CBS domain containing-hemolysin-like protein
VVQEPQRLDAYVATCQIGITASSLLVGFYGQAQLTDALAPHLERLGLASSAAAHSISATAVLVGLTGLQAVMGELVPKNVGVRFPERLAIVTVLPMRWSMALMRPFIWLLNGNGRALLRLLGMTPTTEGLHLHRPDEIILLARESSAGGVLSAEEQRLLENTLRWRGLDAQQVMVPRTRMLTADVSEPPEAMLAALAASPYSRLPLGDGSVDNIVGIVHLKDLLCLARVGSGDVRAAMRTPPFVPVTAPAAEVFARLQSERYQIAIVLDEFGGTAGMATLDDLVEVIFGELRDEFDTELPPIMLRPDNTFLVSGDTRLDQVNHALGLALESEGVNTIGGLLLSHAGAVPEIGRDVPVGSVTLRAERMDGRSVTSVALRAPEGHARRWRERNQ